MILNPIEKNPHLAVSDEERSSDQDQVRVCFALVPPVFEER
jgi:hypothetical protein